MEDIIHIGLLGDNQKYQVCIKQNDPVGIPCVHILDIVSDQAFIVCIELLTGKRLFPNGMDKIPANLGVQYDIFMEKYCEPPYVSNYEKALRLWNSHNAKQIDEGLIMVLCHDDSFVYLKVRREDSGLPMDVFVPDGSEYKQYGHPLWVYMDACLDEAYYEAAWIPIRVEKKPSIAIGTYNTNVSGSDIQKVYAWIRLNRELITALSENAITNEDFINTTKSV